MAQIISLRDVAVKVRGRQQGGPFGTCDEIISNVETYVMFVRVIHYSLVQCHFASGPYSHSTHLLLTLYNVMKSTVVK
jgi:hypothetical protein